MSEYNEHEELISADGVQEKAIEYSQGSFIVNLPNCGYFNINPEYIPYKNSIITTGRYHIYFLHPEHGSSTFYVARDETSRWKEDGQPGFVKEDIIVMIGEKIDKQSLSNF